MGVFRLHTLLLTAIVLVFALIYQHTLAPLYAYIGMVPLTIDVEYDVFFAFCMVAIGSVFPHTINRPSDFFLFFYTLISVLWMAAGWPITGFVSGDGKWILFAILFLPVLVFLLLRSALSRLGSRYILPIQMGSERFLVPAFLFVLLLGAFAAFSTVGAGSLNWEEMYVRRHAARGFFAGNPAAAYITGMATNGALPLLGFIAGYRRSLWMAATCIAFIVLMFFLIGLKSPAINFTGLFVLGVCFSFGFLRSRIVPLVLTGILMVYSMGAVLSIVWENDFVADYLIRRISMVQIQLQSYYLDFWLKGGAPAFGELLSGKSLPDLTYVIGYLYLKSEAANANTNTFIYAFVKGGYVGYLTTILSVSAVFLIMDYFHERTRQNILFATAALFAVLVSEQVWSTSLLTSGIGLSLVLIMLFSYRDERRAGQGNGDRPEGRGEHPLRLKQP